MPKRFYKLAEAMGDLSISRTKLYEEMAAGRLQYVQYGRRASSQPRPSTPSPPS